MPQPLMNANPGTSYFEVSPQLQLPDGVRCEVTLSALVTAGHFFLQQPTHPTFAQLQKLDQFMLAVYGQSIGIPELPKPFEVGIICASPVMAGWYRAQTIAVYPESDEILVKFVDYGGYSAVPAKDLRQIRYKHVFRSTFKGTVRKNFLSLIRQSNHSACFFSFWLFNLFYH